MSLSPEQRREYRAIAHNLKPVIIVGDSTWMVHSLKLSPNLRKKSEKSKDGKDGEDKGFAEDDKKVALMMEVTKLKNTSASADTFDFQADSALFQNL